MSYYGKTRRSKHRTSKYKRSNNKKGKKRSIRIKKSRRRSNKNRSYRSSKEAYPNLNKYINKLHIFTRFFNDEKYQIIQKLRTKNTVNDIEYANNLNALQVQLETEKHDIWQNNNLSYYDMNNRATKLETVLKDIRELLTQPTARHYD